MVTPETSNEIALIDQAEEELHVQFRQAEAVALFNTRKILDAFRQHRLTEEFFAERTGYGMDDAGREAMDAIYATVFGAEAAAVRMQFVSGTHALASALFGNLRAGDRLAVLTGPPYDTLEKVIGDKVADSASLVSHGVSYVETDVVPFLGDENACLDHLAPLVSKPTRMVHIQKSCGYSFARRSLLNAELAQICRLVRQINSKVVILVDNCYGEFVEVCEPLAAGADLVAGSLIKNPGGGLALTGGYVAGGQQYVEEALKRLTAPGICGHLGISFNQGRLLMQGLFSAPAVVCGALKGAMLFAQVFDKLGFEVKPLSTDARGDIIQAVKFGSAQRLTNFLKAIQQFSPVNAHVTPEPADMPGYEDKVIMAGGTFIEGSTIEFSADGPLRPPYAAYIQGGLTYMHVKCALLGALEIGVSGEFPFLKG